MLHVINAAIIQDGRILLVEKEGVMQFPGGKLERGETDEVCLRREIKEELSGTLLRAELELFGEYKGKSHKGDPLLIRIYLASILGRFKGISAEIKGYAWAYDADLYHTSKLTQDIIEDLRKEDYLYPIL